MVESVTEIKSGITINVDASVKTHLICKRIIFGLLPQEVIKCLHKNCFDKFIDTVSVFCCWNDHIFVIIYLAWLYF